MMTALTAVALAVPVLAALALRRRPTTAVLRGSPLATAPAAVLALAGPWVDAQGAVVAVDQLARPLLLVCAALYAAALAAVAAVATERAGPRCALLLACFTGNVLVLLAAHVVVLLVGCLVTTAAVHAMLVLERTAAARRAGRIYLALSVLSDAAVVVALVLVARAGGARLVDAPSAVASSPAGTAIVGLLVVGFGIKAATFPLHGWLPIDEAAAAVPVGAVLSGAVVKVGLVGWLRFLPLGEEARPGWATALIVVALVGAFGALVPGVLTDDPEVSLAYSTVGQMGFLGVLVGVALGVPELAEACVLTAVVYAVHHGMAKGGLVLAVGAWERYGAGRARPVVLGGTAVLALAVTGAPLGSGAVAKYAAKRAVGDAPFLVDVTAALPLVATVSTLLLVRAAVTLRRGGHAGEAGPDLGLAAWAVLGVGGTVGTWLLAALWLPPEKVPRLDAVTAWGATWPILLGLMVAGVVAAAGRAGLLPRWLKGARVPPGDLVALADRLVRRRARRADLP